MNLNLNANLACTMAAMMRCHHDDAAGTAASAADPESEAAKSPEKGEQYTSSESSCSGKKGASPSFQVGTGTRECASKQRKVTNHDHDAGLKLDDSHVELNSSTGEVLEFF